MRVKGLHQMERQDLPCTYLAHHELESVNIIIITRCPLFWHLHQCMNQLQSMHVVIDRIRKLYADLLVSQFPDEPIPP